MIKRKLKKIIVSIVAFAFLSQGLFMVNSVLAGVYPVFNDCPQDLSTLRLKNKTQNDDVWKTSVSANPGDRIAFDVYYHNVMEGTVAENTKIRLDFIDNQNSKLTFKAYLYADNADYVTGEGYVYVDCSEGLEFTFDNRAFWYPNQGVTAYQKSVTFLQGNSILVDIGDIAGGWSSQGHLVFEGTLSDPQPKFNFKPEDKETLRLKNRTEGDTVWQESISADPGDRIAFDVYYHNGVNCSVANNTNLKIVYPTYKKSQIISTAYVRASNAATVNDAAAININGSEQLTFDNTALWYPNQSSVGTSKTVARTSNSVEINIGDIKGCWEYQGHAVFEAVLSGSSGNPNLTINKTVKRSSGSYWSDSVSVNPSDNIEFKIKIQSTGDKTAEDVIIKDILPSKISYQGDLRIDGSYSSYNITSGGGINIGDISPGQTKTITFDARIYSSGNFSSGVTTLTNYARVYADDISQKEDTATVKVQKDTVIDGNPNLTINKTVKRSSGSYWSDSVSVNPSDNIEFKIEIQSTGDKTAEDVIVKDILPSKISYQGDLRIDGSYSSGNITYSSGVNIGDMSPGQTKTITFDARIYSSGSFSSGVTTLTNYARVHADDVSQKEDTAIVKVQKDTVIDGNPNLTINKTVKRSSGTYWSDSLNTNPSDNIEFKIEIQSTGDKTAEDVIVKDILPSKISYQGDLRIDGSYSSYNITSGGGINIGDISPGQTKTITFDARIYSSGNFSSGVTTLTNYARVHADDVSQKEDTATVKVQKDTVIDGSPNLAISKLTKNIANQHQYWHESITVKPGDKIAFYIKVKANSNYTVTNVTVRDILPYNISYLGDLRIDGSYVSGDIVSGINIGSLSPYQSKIITFEARVDSQEMFAFGQTTLLNTASAYGSGITKTDTATVMVIRTSVAGATDVITGISDKLLNYLILPFLMALALVYLFRNQLFQFDEWMTIKARDNKEYQFKKALNKISSARR